MHFHYMIICLLRQLNITTTWNLSRTPLDNNNNIHVFCLFVQCWLDLLSLTLARSFRDYEFYHIKVFFPYLKSKWWWFLNVEWKQIWKIALYKIQVLCLALQNVGNTFTFNLPYPFLLFTINRRSAYKHNLSSYWINGACLLQLCNHHVCSMVNKNLFSKKKWFISPKISQEFLILKSAIIGHRVASN